MLRNYQGSFAIGVWLALAGYAATAQAASYQVIHSFDAGDYPYGGLINVGDKLIGTTTGGGDPACQSGCGKVFFIIRSSLSAGNLYLFKGPPSDGSTPGGNVTELGNVLYGAAEGGSSNLGIVFAIDLATGKDNVVHSFEGGSDGTYPAGDLIVVNGLLYGTTIGDESSPGTVYSLNPATGLETVLHLFNGGVDGNLPYSSLINVGGTLYGTTYYGGKYNFGTVFSLSLTNNAEKVVYSFKGGTDGAGPLASLINVGGVLYGTAQMGGATLRGTVFSINPKTGDEKIVYSFKEGIYDGLYPNYGRLVYVGGKLFGVTSYGGAGCTCGTVFEVDPATGKESVLHRFSGGSDGKNPDYGLINVGGHMFGVTSQGGTYNSGTVFEITP